MDRNRLDVMTSVLICHAAVLLGVVARATHAMDLRLECLADAYRGPGRQGWKGYTLEDLTLPTLGSMKFMLAVPGDWELEACCQNLQLKFDHSDLEALLQDEGYLLPKAEWTLCSQAMRLYTCYGFVQDDVQIQRSQIPHGSWWINIQHCFQPHKGAISYELGTFGESGSSDAQAPRYSGSAKVTKLSPLHADLARDPPNNPCLVDGHVNTDEQWFGYLAKMEIPKDSSISYRFVFKMGEPSNDAPLTVLFYTQTDLDSVKNVDTCEGRTSVLTTPKNSYKYLPLSISNIWSGCFVDSFNGTATFICEGGRTLAEQQTLNIAVSNCKLTKGLQFNYFLEFLNFKSCPPGQPASIGQKLVGDGATRCCNAIGPLAMLVCTLLSYSLKFYY